MSETHIQNWEWVKAVDIRPGMKLAVDGDPVIEGVVHREDMGYVTLLFLDDETTHSVPPDGKVAVRLTPYEF